MKRKYNLTGSTLNDAEPSVVESLSVSLVALARALTLLKWYDEASVVTRNALNAADTAKGIFEDSKPESSHQHANYTGGKSMRHLQVCVLISFVLFHEQYLSLVHI
jgi:hypothetical protein